MSCVVPPLNKFKFKTFLFTNHFLQIVIKMASFELIHQVVNSDMKIVEIYSFWKELDESPPRVCPAAFFRLSPRVTSQNPAGSVSVFQTLKKTLENYRGFLTRITPRYRHGNPRCDWVPVQNPFFFTQNPNLPSDYYKISLIQTNSSNYI